MLSVLRAKRRRSSPSKDHKKGKATKKPKKQRQELAAQTHIDSFLQPPYEQPFPAHDPMPLSSSFLQGGSNAPPALTGLPAAKDTPSNISLGSEEAGSGQSPKLKKGLNGHSLSSLREYLAVFDIPSSPQSPLADISQSLEQKMGDSCLIAARAFLVILDRLCSIEKQIASIQSHGVKMIGCQKLCPPGGDLLKCTLPAVNPCNRVNSAGLSESSNVRPTAVLKADDNKANSKKTQLIWSSRDVLLTFPGSDARQWSNKPRIAKSLSLLTGLRTDVLDLERFYYLPSVKGYKRLFLTMKTQDLCNRIFRKKNNLSAYNIGVQRVFKQVSGHLRFKLKPKKEGANTSSLPIEPPIERSPVLDCRGIKSTPVHYLRTTPTYQSLLTGQTTHSFQVASLTDKPEANNRDNPSPRPPPFSIAPEKAGSACDESVAQTKDLSTLGAQDNPIHTVPCLEKSKPTKQSQDTGNKPPINFPPMELPNPDSTVSISSTAQP